MRQFCMQRQVDEQRYYYWRRILANEQGADSVASLASRFVLVRPEAAPAVDNASAALELVLDRGWRLRISCGG